MHELVVLSGKGGTGKTSLVGALAALGGNQVLCDADVDAADLHLLLEPTILERHDFYAGHQAVIREDRCLQVRRLPQLVPFSGHQRRLGG